MTLCTPWKAVVEISRGGLDMAWTVLRECHDEDGTTRVETHWTWLIDHATPGHGDRCRLKAQATAATLNHGPDGTGGADGTQPRLLEAA